MAVVNTSRTFTNNEQITSTKLNQIMDESSFISDAIVPNQGLQITAGGKMQVPNSGITTALIGDNQVTTSKIPDSAVTAEKLASSLDLSSKTITLPNNSVTAEKLNGAQTGTAPIFGVRAWVRFDGNKNSSGATDASNTARQILGSGNVTSVTKISSGRYTVDFEVDLPSSNYTMTGHRAYEAGDSVNVTVQADPSVPQTAGSFTFYTLSATSGAANSNDVQVMFIG
jgi:hypothetical protein